MCLKLKYFVLALFLGAVASTPYNIPRNNGNYNPEAIPNLNNEYDIQKRNEDAILPRSLPTYMSPVPTAVDSNLNEEILSQSSNFRNLRSLNYNDNENEYPRRNDQPRVAQSMRSYTNPSSSNENGILSELRRQNQPISYAEEPSVPVNGRERQNKFYGDTFKQLPFNDNVRSESSSHVRNINYEPLKQSAPEQRIAFQRPISPKVLNLHEYRPATPVQNFNENREWANIAQEQPTLPNVISERSRNPVDIQRNQINGQQPKPFNAVSQGTSQQYNIQKIISNQRIQNILSSTKQTKRYMVIHPNGTVEHVDNLAPVAARHPNYVLVNAGHVVPANKPKLAVQEKNEEISEKKPMATVENVSSSKVTVSVPQIPETIKRNEESSAESSIGAKPVSTSAVNTLSNVTQKPKSTIASIETVVNQETEGPEKNTGVEDKSEIQTSTSLKTAAEDNAGVKESKENISPPNSPVAIPIETVTENVTPGVTPAPANENNEEVVPQVETTSENNNDSLLQSTQDIENAADDQTDDVDESDLVETNQSTPMVYYTSDPDFWSKVTDGKDSNFIYFFHVKPSPRVETDRQRTIYPDGSILEELTETVWDGEDGEPKVTKSSKLIRPGDL